MRPPLRRRRSLGRPYFVGTVAWYADVILSFKHHLEVPVFEGRGAAEFGEFAGGADEVVDEVVCDLEEELPRAVSSGPLVPYLDGVEEKSGC